MFQFKIHKDTEKMMMLIVIEKYLEKFFFEVDLGGCEMFFELKFYFCHDTAMS